MMRRFLCAGACVLLLAGAATAKPGVATTTVNLRAEANTTSEVLAKIPGSGRLDLGECKDGWCAATYKGKSGFVISTAVDATGRTPQRPQGMRRPVPGVQGYDPDDDDFVPAPGYRGYGPPPPAVVYGPGPYYGSGPYYGPGYYGPPIIGFGYYGPRAWRRW